MRSAGPTRPTKRNTADCADGVPRTPYDRNTRCLGGGLPMEICSAARDAHRERSVLVKGIANKGGSQDATPRRGGRPRATTEEPKEEYVTLAELAAWLRIGKGSARAIVVERGEIPYVRVSERVIRLRRSDVERYIESCRVEAAG